MDTFILAEFEIEQKYVDLFWEKIDICSGNFLHISTFNNRTFHLVHISGRINSEYATMLKLKDQFLGPRLRVSFIDNNIKDKYRH